MYIEKINGLIVAENVRYVLCYNHKNELKTVFITDTSFMSESVTTANAIVNEIPKEIVPSKSGVQNFFNDIFGPLKIPFDLKERKL